MSFWENFKALVSKWASANDAKKSGIDAGKSPVASSADPTKLGSEAPPALPPAPQPSTEQGDGLPSVTPKPSPAKSQPKQELVPVRDYTAQDTASVISSLGNVLGNLGSVLGDYLKNRKSGPASGGDLFADTRGSGNTSVKETSTVDDSSEVVD